MMINGSVYKMSKGSLKDNTELLKLIEGGRWPEALVFADEHDADISLNDDYFMRLITFNQKFEYIKELLVRGAKLSSYGYETVYTFLNRAAANKNTAGVNPYYLDLFKLIFSNIGTSEKDKSKERYPTFKNIICTDGVTAEMISYLIQIGFCTKEDIIKFEAENVVKFTVIDKGCVSIRHNNNLDNVFDILSKFDIVPTLFNEALFRISIGSFSAFKYYYKYFKSDFEKYVEKGVQAPKTVSVMRYLAENKIDLFDVKTMVEYLLRLEELDIFKKYLEDHEEDLKSCSFADLSMTIAQDGYEELYQISDEHLEMLKLLVQYNLIDIRENDDRIYHHAHLTKSENAIKYLDTIYTLELKK